LDAPFPSGGATTVAWCGLRVRHVGGKPDNYSAVSLTVFPALRLRQSPRPPERQQAEGGGFGSGAGLTGEDRLASNGVVSIAFQIARHDKPAVAPH
jgi:hypothetical protein